MLVKIVSYKPYSQCYAWYKNLVGKTVNVKEKLPHQEDYIIDDPEIHNSGTIWDCSIHKSDIVIVNDPAELIPCDFCFFNDGKTCVLDRDGCQTEMYECYKKRS